VRRPLIGALALLSLSAGCGRDRAEPTLPSTTATTQPAPDTTTKRLPQVTAEAIPGLETAAFHSELAKLGFIVGSPSSRPGFVTTTSTREGATVSTYGKGTGDVAKIVAETDSKAAVEVLVPLARTVTHGADDRKVETWLKAQLKRGPISATQPRTARQTYGGQTFDLLVTGATATLSIGDVTA
jgi:hypothetical protein